MEYRTLGRTGLRVSAIGLGTMVHAGHFGPMDDKESLGAIAAALDCGVNFIDTSDAYGAGYAETLLGEALKGKRDKVMIATKGGNVMVGPDKGKTNFSVDYIGGVMDESLKRLQTDYIDLYQLHNPNAEVIGRSDIWELLERRKKEGKIRHYGVSVNKMDEALAAIRGGKADTVQLEYNLLAQEPASEALPLAREGGVGVIARAPLRRGLLGGKLAPGDQKRFTAEDVRGRNFPGDAFSKELAKVELFRFLARGRSLAQAAIAFCLDQPAVSVVIAGARNERQLRENAAAVDLKLAPEELRKIAELWAGGLRG